MCVVAKGNGEHAVDRAKGDTEGHEEAQARAAVGEDR